MYSSPVGAFTLRRVRRCGREKTTLHEIVEAGRAKIAVRDVSKYMVEPVWQNAVTWGTPSRLVRLATEQNASLETLGEPIGIADAVYFAAGEAAAVAPTWGCG